MEPLRVIDALLLVAVFEEEEGVFVSTSLLSLSREGVCEEVVGEEEEKGGGGGVC